MHPDTRKRPIFANVKKFYPSFLAISRHFDGFWPLCSTADNPSYTYVIYYAQRHFWPIGQKLKPLKTKQIDLRKMFTQYLTHWNKDSYARPLAFLDIAKKLCQDSLLLAKNFYLVYPYNMGAHTLGSKSFEAVKKNILSATKKVRTFAVRFSGNAFWFWISCIPNNG